MAKRTPKTLTTDNEPLLMRDNFITGLYSMAQVMQQLNPQLVPGAKPNPVDGTAIATALRRTDPNVHPGQVIGMILMHGLMKEQFGDDAFKWHAGWFTMTEGKTLDDENLVAQYIESLANHVHPMLGISCGAACLVDQSAHDALLSKLKSLPVYLESILMRLESTRMTLATVSSAHPGVVPRPRKPKVKTAQQRVQEIVRSVDRKVARRAAAAAHPMPRRRQ